MNATNEQAQAALSKLQQIHASLSDEAILATARDNDSLARRLGESVSTIIEISILLGGKAEF